MMIPEPNSTGSSKIRLRVGVVAGTPVALFAGVEDSKVGLVVSDAAPILIVTESASASLPHVAV